MAWLSKKRAYPIGIDLGEDFLKVAQLADDSRGIKLIAGGSEQRPAQVEPGSPQWQRWAIQSLSRLTGNGRFRRREVIAAMPPSDVFVDQTTVSGGSGDKVKQRVFARIKQKLPFEPDEAVIKYIESEGNSVVVAASERAKIDRHLAIYENANLRIKSIAIWPVALTNAYTRFFGRRKTDIEAVVMLVDIERKHTNVVICRHKNLLFARSISIGVKQPAGLEVDNEQVVARLVMELDACRRQFSLMHRKAHIERLIFISGQSTDGALCAAIARQLTIPAQMGDCLAAVQMGDSGGSGIDRRGCPFSWATVFGLSLS